jgi:galactosylceramidase
MLCGVTALVLTQTASAETRIVLDDADSGRVFEGIGAVSAGASTRNLVDYPEKQRSEVLDYMFKPKFGASLQHLKVEIGGGENSTCGSEPTHALTREELADPKPRGYEFWLMAEARKRNPKILLDCLPWSYPYWISSPFSQDSADWYVAFLDVAKKYYGLKMDWVAAAWNEHGTDLNWIAKTLRPTLNAHGYADVKLQAPDNNGSWGIFDELARNPEADKVIKAVGYHYPNEFGPQVEAEGKHAAEKVIASGKPLWSSEEFSYSGKTWEKAMLLAQVYNKNYIRSRITKTEVWSVLSGIYPGIAFSGVGLMEAQTPWSGYYDVYPAVWTTAHTAQFAEPGWRYMDKACAKIETNTWAGSYVALRNPANGDWSLIVCADKPVTFQVQVAGKLAKGDVHVWKSNEKIQFIEEKPLRLTNGAFTISLEGNSVYTLSTTTGQKKGAYPAPPPAAVFPLPYNDDFESYAAGVTPKYTSDQKGSFETAKRKDGKGICLKQIVPKEGILWGGAGGDLPHTVFGDHNWTDYTIQADVLITDGKAGIGGRYWCGEQRGAGLVLQQDGTWLLEASVETVELVNGKENKLKVPPLATGKIDGFIPATWHHLTLVLKGDELTASIDGKEVARVRYEKFYPAHKSGRAYLMSSYAPNCFDNVVVTP